MIASRLAVVEIAVEDLAGEVLLQAEVIGEGALGTEASATMSRTPEPT
jgi:hypothetical protein